MLVGLHVFVLLLAVSMGCAAVTPPSAGIPLRSPPARAAVPLSGPVRTIVIDAGHGGQDPGTSHFGLKEKHLALDIARRLHAQLQHAGFTVVMTRENDRFIPLSGRPSVANRLKADLFVSIHINANKSGRVSGAEVYYPRVSVVSPNAQWPPSVQTSEIGMPTVTVKQILWDLVLGRTRSHSHRLASTVCSALRQELEVSCKTKSARFVVLREAWMPSVLVEVGYVSNLGESRRLNMPDYREAAARSITQGILSYARDIGAEHL